MDTDDVARDAVLVLDSTGRITDTNDRVADVFGLHPDAVVGEEIELLLASGDRADEPGVRDLCQQPPAESPRVTDLDFRGLREDGTTFPADVALHPLEWNGQSHVIAVVRDVSDRLELHRRCRSTLEAIPDPVVVAEVDGGDIVDANQRAVDLLGYSRDTLLDMNQLDLHPDADARAYRETFDTHVTEGRSLIAELPDGTDIQLEAADGRRFPVEINAQVFEEGDEARIVGVFRDVSESREHQRQLRALHAATRELMDARTPEAVGQIAVAAGETILGYDMNGIHRYDADADGLAPLAWTDTLESVLDRLPTFEPGKSIAWRVYESGTPSFHDDVREDPDVVNPETPIRTEMSLPLGEHGVFIFGATEPGVFDARDRTLAKLLAANVESAFDQVQRQVELEQRESDLGRERERLAEFAEAVAHDVRSPLAAASGHLELLGGDHDPASDEGIDHLSRALEALDRVEEVVERTLAQARDGRVTGETEPVRVDSLARKCWEMTAAESATLDVQDRFTIEGDRTALKRLLENVFRNALEHAGEDVRVRIEQDGPDGFVIADDGPGIPPGRRSEVLEPGHTSQSDGTGIGLAIVRRIAAAHGWTIGVEESESGGLGLEFGDVEVVTARELAQGSGGS